MITQKSEYREKKIYTQSRRVSTQPYQFVHGNLVNARCMLIKQSKKEMFHIQSPLLSPIKTTTHPLYRVCFLLTRLLNRVQNSSKLEMDCFSVLIKFPLGFSLLFFVYFLLSFLSYCAH
jgi:hypothetical protein